MHHSVGQDNWPLTLSEKSANQFIWDTKGLGFVELCDCSRVIGCAHGGNLVEEGVVIGTRLPVVRIGHPAPLIPGEHLDLVQRREIFDGIAADLGWSPILGAVHAEAGSINVIAAECTPRLTARKELPFREVLRMFDDPLPKDLRIQANPPIIYVVAVLDDPVIDCQAFFEIGCEPTADPSRNTSITLS